ncbi:hypothetical protein HJC23_002264 [Cyclotella cryptica]|uniref:Uncharacterized protein n=1 Tax=Cyclotella cryptica TaxID=29204 RepID=A0ABD3QHZ2_9STRA
MPPRSSSVRLFMMTCQIMRLLSIITALTNFAAIAFVPPRASLLLSSSSVRQKIVSSAGSINWSCRIDCTEDFRLAATSLSTTPVSSLTGELTNRESFISPSLIIPSVLTGHDEIPEFQANAAFQDQVTLTDLTSDPALQAAFAASVIAIVLLFIAKSIVTQMDDAVQKTAMDFDRVMKTKYARKWGAFTEEEEEKVGGAFDREEREADRIQRIVEEMERLMKEEPEFFERVMRDVDRQI